VLGLYCSFLDDYHADTEQRRFDMNPVSVELKATGESTVVCTPAGDTILTDGEADTFACPGSFGPGKVKRTIEMNYTNTQTSMHIQKWRAYSKGGLSHFFPFFPMKFWCFSFRLVSCADSPVPNTLRKSTLPGILGMTPLLLMA